MAKASPLASMTAQELERELRRRQRRASTTVRRLTARRERLLAKVTELDAEIAKLGGRVRGGGGGGPGSRPRAKNDSNLADALLKLLAKAPLSVTDAAEAVQKAGYVTTSPSFRTIVNQTLIKDKRFKRVSRGQYQAKAG